MTQDGRRLGRVNVELLHDCVLERVTAPVEDARELAGAAAGDEQGGRLVPDRHDHRGGVVDRPRSERLRLDEGAQQAQCLEVEASDLDTCCVGYLDIGLDLVARGDDEQDPPRRLTIRGRTLLEDPVVEHRLVLSDRQHLVRLEPDRVVELGLVVDARDLERPDTDAIARKPDADILPRQLVLVEEQLQLVGERFLVTDLAVDDQTALDRPAGELHELVPTLGLGDDCCGDLGSADLEADDGVLAPATATLA